MRRMEIIAFAAAALAYATPAVAQGKGKGRGSQRTSATADRTTGDIFGTTRTSGRDRVPPGHLPRAGMCRVWIDGVPPGHQPPVTDCATAQMQRTANSRVIYGDDTPFPGKGRRSANTADGRVVTNDGRECVQRTDRNGNVRYECRDGRNDPGGIYTDRGRVYGRDDDDDDDDGGFISRDNDRDDFELRGAGNAGNGKGKVKNKSKGKRGRG